MSDLGDYEDDMLLRLSDRDADRLVRGEAPSADLAELAGLLGSWRELYVRPEDEDSGSLAAAAARLSVLGKRVHQTGRTESPVRRTSRLRPRTAAVLAVGLAAMTAGVAFASNGSSPGDRLYGVDRALEQVGVGNGGAIERLDESRDLRAAGHPADALTHAAEAATQEESSPDVSGESRGSDALLAAAERLRQIEEGGANAAEVRAKVAAMLEYMATTEATGSEFGQGVADRAKEIGNGGAPSSPDLPDQAGEHGPPDGVPPGPPDDVTPGPPAGEGG
jgi:hypothetical protein